MIIIDNIAQGSIEWYAEKLGKPSASNVSRIITSDGKPSKQREGYLYELAAEILTGKQADGYQNEIMQAGKDREDSARKFYEFLNDVKIEQVGVIYKDDKKSFLCSPDGIRRETKRGLELKNPLAKTHVKYLFEGGLPSDYFGQVQSSLWVTGWERWDFMSCATGLKPLILSIEPDKKYLAALDVEIPRFCADLQTVVNKLKGA